MPKSNSNRNSTVPTTHTWQSWLRRFWPAPLGINQRERWRMALGSVLGVFLTALLSRWWSQVWGLDGLWMVASFGASVVLVFGLPASPLAQPWPVLGGSVLSALVGALCAWVVADPVLAGALAVGLAIALMVQLRCLHPPGGAVALWVVLNQADGLHLALFPVLFNMLALLLIAVLYNSLTGRSYPHPQHSQRLADAPPSASGFTTADVDAALAHYNQVLDISRADLEGLLHQVGRAAFQRTLGELRCADIMSRPPLFCEPAVALKDAWALLRSENIKALPVIDAQQQVVGIVTVADFMRLVNLDLHDSVGRRLRNMILGGDKKPKRVLDIMSAPVQTALTGQHVMDLVPLFSHGGHHHIPIIDDAGHLQGIVTQTDLVRALARAVQTGQ